jgi:SAM-dependent methyltransferase
MNSQEVPMFEFPRHLLPLLRCSHDAGELVCKEIQSGDIGLIESTLHCSKCSEQYRINNVIACLLKAAKTAETLHEMNLKDLEYKAMPLEFVPPDSSWRSKLSDAIEIPPHLRMLELLNGHRVLELGCGDGRFTMLMAQRGADILAVDFSIEALRKLASRLRSGVAPTSFEVAPLRKAAELAGHVGLVQADASEFHAAPFSFDVALSASPLDSRDERMRMYCAVAASLKDDGHYVAGVEHDDLLRRLFGMPIARRYTPGGIFIEHFDINMLRREMAPYFFRLRFQLVRAKVPLARRLPLKLAIFLSMAAVRLPLLRQLGEILLVSAERPIRPHPEGVRRPGSAIAKGVYRWFKRWKGEENVWDVGEAV